MFENVVDWIALILQKSIKNSAQNFSMHTIGHKTKCPISKNGQFTWPLCTMRKIMKCEGFELIWNTLSLSKLKEITRSRFTWRVGTEKRSRTPLFLYNFQHDTPLRIDCISNMLNLHFLPTGKNIVHKSSICPPTWLPFLKLCIQSSLQVFPCMVNGLIQIWTL